MTVEGIAIDYDNNSAYFFDDYPCVCYSVLQNYSCICQVSKQFELSVPPADQDGSVSTIQKFLNSHHIRIVLEALDPSFYTLARLLQYTYTGSDYDDEDYLYHLEINFKMDKFEIIVQNLSIDVHNALYLTLSWVSLIRSI